MSFNFMAIISICSDFGAQENSLYCFHCFPISLPWSDGTGYHDLSSHAATTVALESRACSPTREAPAMRNLCTAAKSSHCSPQPEKAHAKQRRPRQPKIKEFVFLYSSAIPLNCVCVHAHTYGGTSKADWLPSPPSLWPDTSIPLTWYHQEWALQVDWLSDCRKDRGTMKGRGG